MVTFDCRFQWFKSQKAAKPARIVPASSALSVIQVGGGGPHKLDGGKLQDLKVSLAGLSDDTAVSF